MMFRQDLNDSCRTEDGLIQVTPAVVCRLSGSQWIGILFHDSGSGEGSLFDLF